MFEPDLQQSRLKRLFLAGFTALDIAEPLVSFDAGTEAEFVRAFMLARDFDLVGIRQDGVVTGYARRDDLSHGVCGDHRREFSATDDLVPDTAPLTGVVRSLAINTQCFVVILGRVGAIVTLSDLEKPPMRMFLFGTITLGELLMTRVIRLRHGDGSWQQYLSAPRVAKAEELQQERRRRGQDVDLVDCLQYGDKGTILSHDDDFCAVLGFASRREARRAVKEMETLRNNLAHAQPIVAAGWPRIAAACSRFEDDLEGLVARLLQPRR